jgi:hypothetical protein
MSFIKNSNSQITTGYLWSFFGAYLRPGNLGSVSAIMRQSGHDRPANQAAPAALGCEVANDEAPTQTGTPDNDIDSDIRPKNSTAPYS